MFLCPELFLESSVGRTHLGFAFVFRIGRRVDTVHVRLHLGIEPFDAAGHAEACFSASAGRCQGNRYCSRVPVSWAASLDGNPA